MAYQQPSIGPEGLTLSFYPDILADLLTVFQTIYGQNTYLKASAPDYQLQSMFAAKAGDLAAAIEMMNLSKSPVTAVGADLDAVVKLNGLVRLQATSSTATLTITGTPGAVITNGIVTDANGNLWNLPPSLTIPAAGTLNATATCQTTGAIAAAAGTISTPQNPSSGWLTATNAFEAATGTPQETDAQLRARQALSVALPSLTMLGSTEAAIAATAGVTRYNILENPTGSADSYGNPAHSLTCVVEGGADLAVAQAIYSKHGIGCLMNGTTTVAVTDAYTGTVINVGYYRPTYLPILVAITVKPLTGFTTATATAIQTAIVNYLNSLEIGENVTLSALYFAVGAVMANISLPTFSVTSLTIGTTSSNMGTSDIAVTFNQVAQGVAANVTVTS